MMNIIFTIAVVIVLCPCILYGIVLPHNVFITACYSILNNFYTLLVNLIFIGLLCKIKGLCA